MSSRYTIGVSRSFSGVLSLTEDWANKARRAAKYPVGESSVLCSFSVASTAWRTTAVWKKKRERQSL